MNLNAKCFETKRFYIENRFLITENQALHLEAVSSVSKGIS